MVREGRTGAPWTLSLSRCIWGACRGIGWCPDPSKHPVTAPPGSMCSWQPFCHREACTAVRHSLWGWPHDRVNEWESFWFSCKWNWGRLIRGLKELSLHAWNVLASLVHLPPRRTLCFSPGAGSGTPEDEREKQRKLSPESSSWRYYQGPPTTASSGKKPQWLRVTWIRQGQHIVACAFFDHDAWERYKL